jgi:hypothetical protein
MIAASAPILTGSPFAKDPVGLKGWPFEYKRLLGTEPGKKYHRIETCLVNAEHHHTALGRAAVRFQCEPSQIKSLPAGPPCQHDRTTIANDIEQCCTCVAERKGGVWV